MMQARQAGHTRPLCANGAQHRIRITMPSLSLPADELHFDVIDVTAPWVAQPQTILFHHGLGASSGTWAGWMPGLVDRFRIVTFDMRGHGRSTRARGDGTLTLDRLVEDVFAVADAAGVERFHLVGESIGGTIALKAAIAKPQRLHTVTVSNGAHVGGSIRSIDDWQQIMDAKGMSGWSEHMMRSRFFEGAISDDMWRWYETEQANASAEFILAAVRLLAGADLSSEVQQLRLPVLLLHGDSSPFIPVSVLADLKARLADARLHVFAHARHGLPFSHAKECAQALRSFLTETRGDQAIQTNP
jgi:pimeloyl-ACP methyl ester carboxylesterase